MIEKAAGFSSTPKRPTAKEPPRTWLTASTQHPFEQTRFNPPKWTSTIHTHRPFTSWVSHRLCACWRNSFALSTFLVWKTSAGPLDFLCGSETTCVQDQMNHCRLDSKKKRRDACDAIHLAFPSALQSNTALALAFALTLLFISLTKVGIANIQDRWTDVKNWKITAVRSRYKLFTCKTKVSRQQSVREVQASHPMCWDPPAVSTWVKAAKLCQYLESIYIAYRYKHLYIYTYHMV